jgi:hypothetical protein
VRPRRPLYLLRATQCWGGDEQALCRILSAYVVGPIAADLDWEEGFAELQE